ncbi:unnamed protein product [Cylicocyclus nassatus]|uniref:Acid phosphatase-like protein 2 n=1 Tax=Cylicocyclus nassatus TaxID=53992 RepID=A0AA36HD76_CYLNA|nr:unnamed protein product [Cylicocyclus nassatus]
MGFCRWIWDSVDVANNQHQQRLLMSYSPQGKMRQMRRLRFCVVALVVMLVTYWFIFGDEDSVTTRSSPVTPPEWAEMCEFLERKWQGSEGQIADTGFRLRGIAIGFRHGERSPLITTYDREGCLPFREEDRKDFQQYRSLVSSDDFQFFLRHDKMFENFAFAPSHSECSPGQMTAEGALQHVKLGNYMRKKYSSSSIFAPESRLNVFVTSSPFNRTYQSAIAFTSSFLYPLRVTIPQVFIRASNFTFMCTSRDCQCYPAKQWRLQYEEEHAQYFRERSPEHLRVIAAALKTHPNFNKTIDPFQMIDVALGSYICRRRALPCFGKGNCLDYGFMSELVKETTIRGQVMYDEQSRYIAQKLQLVEAYGVLYHIVEAVEKLRRFAHTNIIQVFSGHDVMLAPLLRVMGVPFVDPPHYASHIVIEFYEPIISSSAKDPIHLRFIYNGVDITNSISFCESHTKEAGLCPAQQLEEFVQKRIFSLLGVSSLRDICDIAAQ